MAQLVLCPYPATCPNRGAKHYPGSEAFDACVRSHQTAAPSAAAAAVAAATAGHEPTTDEYLEIARLDGLVAGYRWARDAGASHGECVEIARLDGDMDGYRWARDAGASHGECVEIARLGGYLFEYQEARDAGASHGECVEIARLGGNLGEYRQARYAGCTHSTIVEAVTVHGLPAGLLRGFARRMGATVDADVATVVFETVADVAPRWGRSASRAGGSD